MKLRRQALKLGHVISKDSSADHASYHNDPLLLRTANALMDYWVTCQYRDCID